MIMHIRIVVAGTLLFVASILCYGCSQTSSSRVVIDRQFLYEIEKAFKQEEKTGKDMSAMYNRIWEDNYYELIYLVTIGDQKATEVSISLIGQTGEPVHLFEEIELLVKPTFESSFGESDYDYFWKTLEKKSVPVQVKDLHVFNFFKPIDWDMKSYLSKHPEVAKFYEEKYGLTEKEEQ
jgi:hypothetical protein